MSDKTDVMIQITEQIIRTLKDEVQYWQREALVASEANDDKKCQDSLRKQSVAIGSLIKLVESYGNL